MTNCSHALLFFLLAAPALPQTFNAKVVSIAHGDTISVLRNGHPQRVRLNGIDCPESCQPFGTKAKQFTGNLAFGKVVTIHTIDVDRYGRIIADVILEDGHNLNHELVKAGLAWWYRRYAPRDSVLEALEMAARKARSGLWVDPHPVAPWEWRKGVRAIGASQGVSVFAGARIGAINAPNRFYAGIGM